MSPSKRVTQLYPQASGSLFVFYEVYRKVPGLGQKRKEEEKKKKEILA
jgi:hypothetical protein